MSLTRQKAYTDKAKSKLQAEKDIKISQNYYINQINIKNLKNKLFRQKTSSNLLSSNLNEKSHSGLKRDRRPNSTSKGRRKRTASKKSKKKRNSTKSFGNAKRLFEKSQKKDKNRSPNLKSKNLWNLFNDPEGKPTKFFFCL